MKLQTAHRIVLCFAVLLISVQPATPGSIFSRFGIGTLRQYNGPLTIGMGRLGVATLHPSALPYMNPAGLSFVPITRFDGSFSFENSEIDFASENARLTGASFNSFQFAFPIKDGWGFGAGIQAMSDVSYKLTRQQELELVTATESIEGNGGLHRGFLQIGGRVTPWLAVGGGLNAYFGRILKTWRVAYGSDAYRNTIDETSSYMRGFGGFGGLFLRLGPSVNAGAIVHFPTSLTTDTSVRYNFSGGNVDEIETGTQLPLIHGYGLSFRPNPRFMAGLDLVFSNWNEVSADEMFGTVTQDTRRIAVGGAYTPSVRVLDGFFRRLTYSIGFIHEDLPYLDSDGSTITERTVTAGLGIPFNLNRGRVDLGIEFGKRGSLDDNVAAERVFRFTAAVTGGERWFVRRGQ